MKAFDIESWERKEQFYFFKTYEDPFFNITSHIEISNLKKYCKQHRLSFSLACLYIALKSANEILEFKLRFKNENVYLYESLDIGSTVLNEQNTFMFCYFTNQDSIFSFDKKGKETIQECKNNGGFTPKESMLNLIHCSIVPWISFSSFKHARKGDEYTKGIPKIVFGKIFEDQQLEKIPLSVEVHHAFMDGYHVSMFFNKIQQFIDAL